jgi:hypothetical protein
MSPIYVPGKVVLAKTYVGLDDPDAAAYIAAVEAADEAASPSVGALETATKVAIHSFVKGCKNDGIWPAIKASCILAGAKTRLGAMVPLVGAAPTSFNFVDGDYNRKTGLVGNGSTKYLDSNRNNNADPQNSSHNAFYLTTAPSGTYRLMGAGAGDTGSNLISGSTVFVTTRNRTSVGTALATNIAAPSLIGTSRQSGGSYVARCAGVSESIAAASQSLFSGNILIFQSASTYANARLAFYSIGESLDLALLDTRVTDLINAFGAAIP